MNPRIPVFLAAGALALAGCKPKSPDPASPPASESGETANEPEKPSSPEASPVEIRVREIVADQLELTPELVPLTSTWAQLGADDTDTVELLKAFEEGFGVRISPEDAGALKTVGDAVTFFSQNQKK